MLLCRALFEEADSSPYELSEAEYAANEVAFTWVDNLSNLLIVMLRWFQPLLTAGNHEELVSALLEKVGTRKLSFLLSLPSWSPFPSKKVK